MPVAGLVKDRNAIGIGMDEAADLRLPVGSALIEGFHYMAVLTKATFVGAYDLIANAFRGHADFSEVTGPVGIAGIVGDAARMGWTHLLMITAIISINLAVINLIPVPALDGGRILFVAIEGAIRRRIPHKATNLVNLVGFGVLIVLMVLVTFRDVVKLWH
jgi:regulator of sigma E protease